MRNSLILIAGLILLMTAKDSSAEYATVNGLKMYYEIYGTGEPLVLIHGGGSTIGTSFGRVLPLFAKRHRVIAVEMQAHGHTADRNTPETFVQDADDIAELLKQLSIEKADVLGFSNGGQTIIEIAKRHPEKLRRIILASMFYKRDSVPEAFWAGFDKPDFKQMPQIYKDEYLKINPDPAALTNMFNQDVQRMKNFKGWTEADIKSIKARALIVIGDRDLTTPEHAVEMHRLMSGSSLMILPGIHGAYMGEAMTAGIGPLPVEYFVDAVNDFLAEGTSEMRKH